MSVFSEEQLTELESIAPDKDFIRDLEALVGDVKVYPNQDKERLSPGEMRNKLNELAQSVRAVDTRWKALDQQLQQTVNDLFDECECSLSSLLPTANRIELALGFQHQDDTQPSGGTRKKYAIRLAALLPTANRIEELALYVGESQRPGGPRKQFAATRSAGRLAEVFDKHKLKVVCTPESDFVVTLDCVLRASGTKGNA